MEKSERSSVPAREERWDCGCPFEGPHNDACAFASVPAPETYETVEPEKVFFHIDRCFPDMSNQDIADILDVNNKRVFEMRRQKFMRLETADRILTALDLSYLLSTGDIPIKVNEKAVYKKKKLDPQEALIRSKDKEITRLYKRISDLERQKEQWKDRAMTAEYKLRHQNEA